MAAAVPNEPANSPLIDGLLSGVRWDALDLTYSFPAEASFYGADYGLGEPQNSFNPLNGAQIAAARAIFSMISSVTNLTFAEIEESETIHADLRLASSDTPVPAWTHTIEDGAEGGDSWFANSSGLYDAPIRGNYAYWVFMHEIGHALGLKHGHEQGGFGPSPLALDSMEYSVLTYKSYVGSPGAAVTNEAWGYAQTLMLADIAALQQMYGANYAANSGATTYRWDPKTGQAFINGVGQGTPGANRIFMTVWDGGGTDTYSFSNYKTNLDIDLRPGMWSTVSDSQIAYLGGAFNFARGNIANALLYHDDPRSLIENATGGSGNDRLVGNRAGNILKGGNGFDHLNGLDGADTLIGGSGNDVLRGGSGADVFLFDKIPKRKTNVDRLPDFSVPDDSVYLDNAIFTSLGKGSPMKPQKLKTGFFAMGDRAKDANDFIIYNSKTGVLLYDADGTGPGEAEMIATLPKKLKLTAADFFVT